ncbi:MAG: hypothetical protein K8R35_07435 [Bacteroidales bacterium]|nr:hypothetical protein [Bacteroidales bacterium]
MLIDFTLTGNRWNYFSNEETSLFDSYSPSYIVRNESSFRTNIGIPAANNSLVKTEIAFSWIEDTYYQTKIFNEITKPDESEYFFATAKLIFENNNQNRRQYASRGNRFYGGLFYNAGFEYYTGGFIDTIGDQTREGNSLSWFAVKLQNENFSRITEKFFLGTLTDITISNRVYSENYTATLINSYKFEPTPMSRQIFGSSLRSSSYIAAGIMPVFEITRDINIKGGIYLYSPFYRIKNNNGVAEKGELFGSIRGVGELNIVYHTPVGPLSAGFNYFSNESKKMFYYLNFGYILFNKSGLD